MHRAEAVLLRDYSHDWLQQRTVRGRPLPPRTTDTYRHSLNAWVLPILGDAPVDRITPAHVRRWHAQVSAMTKPTAVRQAYAVLRAVLNTAVADDVLQRNPCRIKGAGQAYPPERPLLDLADVEALTAAMPADLRTLVTLASQVRAGAEADGNRTHQDRMPTLTGFEDRGAHQERVRLPGGSRRRSPRL